MAELSLSDKLRGIKLMELSAEIDSEKPLTIKSTPFMIRVPKSELEASFVKCAVVSRGLTKLTEIIMSGEPILQCSDKKVLDYYQNFIDNIGYRGNDLHWDEFLNRVFLDQFVFGEMFAEKIPGAKGNPPKPVVDLDIVDAKSIDYAKKGESIALDKYGVPLGYVQEIPYGQREISKLEPPEEITIQGNQKWIPRERIAHFKLYNFGSGFKPIGLIEPAYSDIRTFLNLKEAYGEKALTVLFPKYIAIVGDEKHMPTAEITKDMVKKMKESAYKTEMALAWPNDIKVLEARHPDALLNFLNFFMDEIIVSLGLPKSILTGLGEQTNRSTLNVQAYIMILTTRDIIRKTVKTIERQIFKPMADAEGFKVYPTINWNFQKVEDAIKGSLEGGGGGRGGTQPEGTEEPKE